MSRRVKADNGAVTDTDIIDGPDAYPAGGFDIDANVSRADDYEVDIQSGAYEARVTDVTNNSTLNVQVFSTDTGAEIGDGDDISGEQIRYSATKL